MAKLKSNQIVKSDIVEYVDNHSDFAFELQIYNFLKSHKFECEHGGTYQDPLTNKRRQFDVHATWTSPSDPDRLRLAVECKQLQPHFPLVILQVPRLFDEGFHDVIITDSKRRNNGRLATQLPVQGRFSIYNENEFVGKSCAQVGRDTNNEITATDSGIFDKWTQAINSAQALIEVACTDEPHLKEE